MACHANTDNNNTLSVNHLVSKILQKKYKPDYITPFENHVQHIELI
jgi:hypothetical protein